MASLEEITFELAREGLREQAHDADTLRSRAGTLLDRELLARQEGRELPDDSWRGRTKRFAARITRRTAA